MTDKRTYVVLLGAPGAGKGTQAKLLEQATGLPQVSTGDIFRYNLKNETELGKLAKSYMDKGALVPDDVTIRMVEDRLAQPDAARGAIMDGFPRTLAQADAFDRLVAPFGGVAVAPVIVIDDEETVYRITGRRSCRACGSVYHIILNPPKVEGRCDKDNGELYQRDDDQEATVRNRLLVYYKQTAPLIGYYYAKGLLREVNGGETIELVQAALRSLIKLK
ncbi:MAG: adenylate kinase [Anaerolineales bacterium]|nr:adenylate kinase [Anaerolineales bacterium]